MPYISDITDIISTGAVLVGMFFAYRQLQNISVSLKHMLNSNKINVIAHCANRYEKIYGELNPDIDDDKKRNWWYRYWDLYTEQFTFFQKGMLDSDVFELWVNELATVYEEPPIEGYDIRSVNHKEYLVTTLPGNEPLHDFFSDLQSAAKDEAGNPSARANRVHALLGNISVE